MEMNVSKDELRSHIIEFCVATSRAADEMEINFLTECVMFEDYRTVVMSSSDKEFVALITELAFFLKAKFRKLALQNFLDHE